MHNMSMCPFIKCRPKYISEQILAWGMCCALLAPARTSAKSWLPVRSDSIRQTLYAIDHELNQLPKTYSSSAPATMGYRSTPLPSRDQQFPIDIQFREPAPVDLIALIPAAAKGEDDTLKPFGFPVHFYIERILPDGSSELIADYRERPFKIEGVEPQLFPCTTVKQASGIRIVSTKSAADKTVAFAEVFAFAENGNAALNANVHVPQSKALLHTWHSHCLTDGITQHLPVNRTGPLGKTYRVNTDKLGILFDLGREQEIDSFSIWPVVTSQENNSPTTSGIGFPTRISLETLRAPDDKHPVRVYQSGNNLPWPGDTPLTRQIPRVKSRYFKLVFENGFLRLWDRLEKRIAVSEVALLNKGQSLTDNLIVKTKFPPFKHQTGHNPTDLTDGLCSEGQIIPARPWIEQFNRQWNLQRKRNRLQQELAVALQQENERSVILITSAIALIIILILTIWIVRLLGVRKWSRMREQIACDLHDELGANLSSIAHSTELLREMIPDPTPAQKDVLDYTIQSARHTARDTRQFIRFLEQRNTGREVGAQIVKIADQILGPIEHGFNLQERRAFNQLAPMRQWDLFFFLKEALNNVIKHSGATQVQITTRRAGGKLALIIEDNGCGMAQPTKIPTHLQCRADRLKGTLTVTCDHGTHITLTLIRCKKS